MVVVAEEVGITTILICKVLWFVTETNHEFHDSSVQMRAGTGARWVGWPIAGTRTPTIYLEVNPTFMDWFVEDQHVHGSKVIELHKWLITSGY